MESWVLCDEEIGEVDISVQFYAAVIDLCIELEVNTLIVLKYKMKSFHAKEREKIAKIATTR